MFNQTLQNQKEGFGSLRQAAAAAAAAHLSYDASNLLQKTKR